MGLLDAVLGSVLGGQQQQGGMAGGALGNVLGSLLGGGGQAAGGAAQSPLAGILASLLANNGQTGGLGGLTSAFQKNGMGDVIGSWVGSGQNMPISADALGKVLGPDILSQLGAQAGGVGHGDLLSQLSQILPGVVDKMTPEGQAPQGGFGDIASVLAKFGGKA